MAIKKISLWITTAALFIVPFFPLIVANPYFFPFITGKAFFFRIVVEVAFAGWVILAFLDPKYRPKATPLFWAVTLFTIIALIADLVGVNPLRSLWSNFERMEGWITIAHLWAFFIASSALFNATSSDTSLRKGAKQVTDPVRSDLLWTRWFLTSVGVAAVIALIALLQLDGILQVHQSATRVDATLGNAAYMAVYMLIHAGLVVYLFLSDRIRWSWKPNRPNIWVYWLSIIAAVAVLLAANSLGGSGSAGFFQALSAFAGAHAWWFIVALIVSIGALIYPYYALPLLFSFVVFQTQTRGTTLGLVGGIMLALLIYAIAGKKESPRARSVCAGIFVGIILIGVVFWLNRGAGFVQKSDVLSRLASISWNDTSSQARQYIWPMAIQGALHRPLFGWGQENFNYIFNADYNPKMWSQEQWFDRAHNVFLDWLVAGGLVGLVAYLALYVFFLKSVWQSSLSLAQKSVLIGLLAGYAAHNLFVFDNLASYLLFFAALAYMTNHESVTKKSPIFGTATVNAEAIEYIVVPITIVLLVACVYVYNVRLMQANNRLITALLACQSTSADAGLFDKALSVNVYAANQEIREQSLQCAGSVLSNQQFPDPIKQAFLTMASEQVQAQIASTPKDARAYMLGGSFMNAIGQFATAEPLLVSAHALSPAKQTIDFELATSYINNGKKAEAAALLKQAYESAPEDKQAKQAYATSLVIIGQEAAARTLMNNDETFFNTTQMANIFISQKQYGKALAIYQVLAANSPTDVGIHVQLARIQYAAGQVTAAVTTMRAIEKDHPELKTEIETAISQIQK